MDNTIRDCFGRPVPGNLIVRFRDRPVAVCPLCDGQGVRKDGKHFVLCGCCGGDGALTQALVDKLTPSQLDVCKAHAGETVTEPVLGVPTTTPKRRKPEPVAV